MPDNRSVAANNESDEYSGSGSYDSELDSQGRDEHMFQKEVEKIINKVIKVDLGDDVSNYSMKMKMS